MPKSAPNPSTPDAVGRGRGSSNSSPPYGCRHLQQWLASRSIRHSLTLKAIETSRRLGGHRWVVKRTLSWLTVCRHVHRRHEREPEHFLAFTAVAVTLICHRRLTK
ncbi:hypothetical protein GCM10019016_104960 [Streptomyces prasinosporus]|uniref:Transposase DDE domain-containing protein n=1 Tax=Streptomyces prasinosporus TaxID=68256 RepID=A0ABP6UA85_9ACTN